MRILTQISLLSTHLWHFCELNIALNLYRTLIEPKLMDNRIQDKIGMLYAFHISQLAIL